MLKRKLYRYILALVLILSAFPLYAQPGPPCGTPPCGGPGQNPGPPGAVPITGIELIMAAGAALGIHRIYKSTKKDT